MNAADLVSVRESFKSIIMEAVASGVLAIGDLEELLTLAKMEREVTDVKFPEENGQP